MAANVRFTIKGETDATTLARVDDMVCAHFGATVHPVNYFAPRDDVSNWFDSIGLMLACDKRGDDLREALKKIYRNPAWYESDDAYVAQCQIADFLETTFDIESWTSVGKW